MSKEIETEPKKTTKDTLEEEILKAKLKKAVKETLHEHAKMKKTEAEINKINNSSWTDGIKTFGMIVGVGLTVVTAYYKFKDDV